MDINCGIGLNFAETEHLDEPDYVTTTGEIPDKLALDTSTDDHLLVLDQGSPSSRTCNVHHVPDKHMSASDFKLDLGAASDLVSASDFPIETSAVNEISTEVVNEDHEGYSIRHAALEEAADPNNKLNRNIVPSSHIPTIQPNYPAAQIVPVSCVANVHSFNNISRLHTGVGSLSSASVAQLLAMRNSGFQHVTFLAPLVQSTGTTQQCTNHRTGVSIQSKALNVATRNSLNINNVGTYSGSSCIMHPTLKPKQTQPMNPMSNSGKHVQVHIQEKDKTKHYPVSLLVVNPNIQPKTLPYYGTSNRNGQLQKRTELSSLSSTCIASDSQNTMLSNEKTKVAIDGTTVMMTFDCRTEQSSNKSTRSGADGGKTKSKHRESISESCTEKPSRDSSGRNLHVQTTHKLKIASTTVEQGKLTSSILSENIPHANTMSTPNYVSLLQTQGTHSSNISRSNTYKTTIARALTNQSKIPITMSESNPRTAGADVSPVIGMQPLYVYASVDSAAVTSRKKKVDGKHEVRGNRNRTNGAKTKSKDRESTDSVNATEKPARDFKCHLCNTTFNRYGNFKRHVKVHIVGTKVCLNVKVYINANVNNYMFFCFLLILGLLSIPLSTGDIWTCQV